MRRLSIMVAILVFATNSFAQHAHHNVTVAGCVMNMNGKFRLLTHGQTYILKGHQSELFSYNGTLMEVTGTVDDTGKSPTPGIPVVLHITSLKKLADSCQ